MVSTMTMVMLSSCLASSQKYSHRTEQKDKDTNNNDLQGIEEKYRSDKFKHNDLEDKARNQAKSKSEKAGHSNVGSYNTYQSPASTNAQKKCYGTFCTNSAPLRLGHTMYGSNGAPNCCVPNPNMPLQNLLKHVDTCFESKIEDFSKLLQSRSMIVLDSVKNHLDAVNRQLQKHIDTRDDQLISSIENMRTINSSAVLDRVIKALKTLNKANINDVNALSKKASDSVTGIIMQTASQPAALLISTVKDLNTKNGLLLQLLGVLNSMGTDVGQVVYKNTEKMLPELNSIFGIENAVVEKQVLSIIHAQNETLRLQIHLAYDKKLKMVEKEVKSFLDELSLSFTALLTDTGYTISRFVEQACNGQLPIAEKKSRSRRDKPTKDLTQGNVPLPFTPNV